MISRLLKLPLHFQIFIALGLAVVAGQVTRVEGFGSVMGLPLIEVYDFLGTIFIRALKMLIVPLIASAIISAMSGLGKEKAFGRLGLKTLGYYLTTSFLAIVTGLVLVNLIEPGLVDGKPAESLQQYQASEEVVEGKVGEGTSKPLIKKFFDQMIPVNVVKAASDGQMLGLIFFSLLFGYFMCHIDSERSKALSDVWQAIYEVMLRITDLVMKFAPLGVFGLVAEVSAQTSPSAFQTLLWFFLTVLLALGVHMFVAMPLLLSFIGRVNPIKHYQAMLPSLLTAFSTASSSATLPVTVDCLQERARVSKRVTSFTTPLGATVNMDGTALYECVAVVFLMQVYGHEITMGVQITAVVLALVTSIGVAGVPSASLVAIVIILGAVGMPAEAIGLLMVFDRVLDMCRTSVNVFSDSCGAVIIARSEGEKTGVE